MEFWWVLAAPVFFLTIAVIALLCQGMSPMRVARASYKSPLLHDAQSAAAARGEKQTLLARGLQSPEKSSDGRVPKYSETMALLIECKSPEDAESILAVMNAHGLISSENEALHFARHCKSQVDLGALSARAVATIIVALERFAAHESIASCIQMSFQSKLGRECLALKHIVDHHISLFDLIHRRIALRPIRDAILLHFDRQGAMLKQDASFQPPHKLLCDIDDTLLSVLLDTRYPELTVYPGVHQFVHEVLQRSAIINYSLAKHPRGTASEGDLHKTEERTHVTPRLTFITARPELLRPRSVAELKACGFTHFTLLMGQLSSFCGAQRIARRKYDNFTRFRQIFPECRFVFVGDNGQGDIDLGKTLMSPPSGEFMAAVLIHDVVRPAPPFLPLSLLTSIQEKQRDYRHQECEEAGLHLFRSYISAGLLLHKVGVVTGAAVRRIAEQTGRTFGSIKFDSSDQKRALAEELRADVEDVCSQLEAEEVKKMRANLPKELVDVVEIKVT